MLRFRDGDDARRARYFERIDYILAEFREDDVDPPDTFIQNMLALMVEEDRSFESLVIERQAADPDWRELRRVCAGMFLEAYIRATEEGSWPVGN